MAENLARAQAAIQRIVGVTNKQQQAFIMAAEEAGELLRNEVVRTLSSSRSPSAPGQPPGVVTGTLRNSIFANVRITGKNRATIEVGTRVKYAGFLEYGTSRMAPRPFMRNSIAKITPQINAKVQARIRSVLP